VLALVWGGGEEYVFVSCTPRNTMRSLNKKFTIILQVPGYLTHFFCMILPGTSSFCQDSWNYSMHLVTFGKDDSLLFFTDLWTYYGVHYSSNILPLYYSPLKGNLPLAGLTNTSTLPIKKVIMSPYFPRVAVWAKSFL
jgi:hypothetical protein